MENTCEHPIVFLKDIKISEVRAILDYMYKGEVNVAQEELPGLLKVAELLRVKGLVEGESDKLLNSHLGKNGRPLVTTSMTDPPTSSSKLNGGSGGDSSRQTGNGNNGDDRRSTSDSNKDSPNGGMRFMLPSQAGMPQLPMPFLPGMFPNLLGARDGQHRRELENDNEREGSPSPGSGNKRQKVASGSGGSCSSKESTLGGLGHRESEVGPGGLGEKLPLPANLAMDLGRSREDIDKHRELDKESMLSLSASGLGKPDLANYVPNQRLEWKRYKQYTRNDIMAAIEEVKSGMSALQASRKYGVPSRTLYDKVKKMGITTGRQVQRKSLPNYPSQFPGLSGMMNVNDLDERDDTNDSSVGTPGDGMDGRATMVPPSGLNYMIDFMKSRAEHYGNGNKSEGPNSEVSLTPMNLTTMLSNANKAKRSSEQSLSPRSPVSLAGGQGVLHPHHRPGQHTRDLDDDIVDSSSADNNTTRGRARSPAGVDMDHHPPTAVTVQDLKSQFLADLRRLQGSNIPTQSSNAGQGDHLPAPSSTTHSPPAGQQHTPAITPTKMEEENLPPRKRKVSQEHQKSPYNGLHETTTSTAQGQRPQSPRADRNSGDNNSMDSRQNRDNANTTNNSENDKISRERDTVECRN